jgi:uncharacterized phage protein gp47/JayE
VTSPANREFALLPRGDIRDRIVLGNFRAGLRAQLNPDTGLPFAEEEIARATQPRTRWYIEADALDAYGQGEQRRGLFMSDQVQIDRASTAWLEGFHARLWGKEKLPATGGSGLLTVRATPGTIILGSTTVPDATAYSARDTRGKSYQVFSTVVVPGSGIATVTMVARATGSDTNPETGAVLQWITRDPGMEVQSIVAASFTGGTDVETDAEQARRIQSAIRYKEAAGNDAQFRAWARAASNAIEDAFIYPTALHSGSVLVALTQKRGSSASPLARIPAPAVRAAATLQLVPPASPVVPTPPHVLVVPTVAVPTDIRLRVALRQGSAAGWRDTTPFPAYHATAPAVTAVASGTQFDFGAPANATLPGQVALATVSAPNAPRLMVWRVATRSFEVLPVQSIQDLGSSSFRVVLAASTALAIGDWICPECALAAPVAGAVGAYMDARGPGELVATDDVRAARCLRFPYRTEEWPTGVGADLAVEVLRALGGASSDAQLVGGAGSPPIPLHPSLGPNLLTLSKLGVYAL